MSLLHSAIALVVSFVIAILAVAAWLCMACIYALDAILTHREKQ